MSATTNQMTWAYVTSKDTEAMTTLLELLYNQYYIKSKLYVTWDAVSWHNSVALTDWLDHFNKTTVTEGVGPTIELIPLPTSAQFLNVIEGILSGMTRAVVNNSDYKSTDDMKLAISTYFRERNDYFRENPGERAGKYGKWVSSRTKHTRHLQMKATADKVETFLIDATGFLLQTHRAYVGAPLSRGRWADQTFRLDCSGTSFGSREDLEIQQGGRRR